MKIAIDISLVFGENAGVGSYTLGLLEGLAAIDDENEYLLYSYVGLPTSSAELLPRKENFRCTEIRLEPDHLRRLWSSAELPPRGLLGPIDIIHSPFFNAPKDRDARLVVTIYDASFVRFPEFHTDDNRLHCLNGALNAELYADRIVAISHHTKTEIQRYFPATASRIRVTHLAPRSVYYREHDTQFIRKTLEQFRIFQNFILFVGSLEPRKNLENLLRAYAAYAKRIENPESLVVAGAKGWLNEDVHVLASELGLQPYIRWLGYVQDSDLRVLYSTAKLFVYPSFYEGFGLPPVEAMACGAPVITSDTSALPEIVGDAAIMIDPQNVKELSSAIERVLADDDLRLEMRRKSLERSKLFSWEKTARETLAIFHELA